MDHKAVVALNAIKKEFSLPRSEMLRIVKDFHLEMERGLRKKPSSLKMLPAYVDRPSGGERGEFMALDLGGTNFRVLELALKGRGRIDDLGAMKFVVPKKTMAGPGKELFGFLAKSVKKFLAAKGALPPRALNLGFTFSFPVRQRGISSGDLVVWTKGFSARGVEGEDVVRLLEEAFLREGLYGINISALANDTVGTLAARAYGDRGCDMGVIIGTGTNACYVERVRNIKKLDTAAQHRENMIVNIEWGNFDRLGRTRYDRLMDAMTINPGRQRLEKMVSGMYLGELVRLVVVKMASDGIFRRPSSIMKAMKRPMGFGGERMSMIMAGRPFCGPAKVRACSADLGMIKYVCDVIAERAARISAAAMAAVITKMDPGAAGSHTIAIDGSVYEKQPHFSANVKSAMREILGSRADKVRLVLSKDGSGRGAAIVAAAAVLQEAGR